jgi:hypothetical protein
MLDSSEVSNVKTPNWLCAESVCENKDPLYNSEVVLEQGQT